MRYRSAAAFRSGLEARLLRQSRESALDLGRLRRQVVFERLLARLAHSKEDNWILKGGMALEIRLGDRARATRDLDLALRGVAKERMSSEGVREILVEALTADPDHDWFEFRVLDDRPILPKEAGEGGWRFRVHAQLAGKTFERVRMDVVAGFDEAAGIERLRLPAVLEFAGISASEVDAVDRREHFAEKLQALTRQRIRPNTRVKDLADLVLIIDEGLEPDGELLAATRRVFESAGAHEMPAEIEDPPVSWRESYRQLTDDLRLSATSLAQALSKLRAFWSQVRSAEDRQAGGRP